MMKPCVASFLLASAAVAQPYPYRVTDLGTLPGSDTAVARGISPDGTKIVGWSGSRAFLWEEGRGIRELAPLPGYTSAAAYGINDAGFACGQAGLEVTGPEPARAVRWDPTGAPANLGVVASGRFSLSYAINAAGHVAGTSEVLPNTTLWHGFLWNAATGFTDVTPNLTGNAYCRALNELDDAAGWSGSSAWRRTAANGLQFLGQPQGFAFTAAFAINSAGQVCGSATSASGNTERIARYTDGVGWEILGGVGQHNVATGINDFGQVVGASSNAPRAFLYTDGIGLQDLNLLVDPAGLWFIQQGYDINDRGQISGHAFSNALARTRAIRLDPQFVTARGAGCAGGGGHVPKLGVAGLPRGGQRLSLLLAEGRRNGPALLALSATTHALPLPGGCTLLVGLDAATVPVTLDGIGRAVLPVDLPLGMQPVTMHLQYVSLDPAAANGALALSNAVELRVQ